MAVTPINDTTYEVTLIGGDKVEIGDREATTFKPHIKLNRWGGECFIAIQPAGEIEEEVEHEVEGDKVKCKYKVKQGEFEFEWETEFYPLEPRTIIAKDKDGNDVEFKQNELGGFEFEVILKEKPPTNKIVFDIETQGLKFYPQSYEIAEDSTAPENVRGSIAVYHATRTPFHKNKDDAEKYKCGKAFHIYRPHYTDSVGKETWCDLHIDEQKSLITATIPQDFLNSAVYPIVGNDLTFGYTTEGGSWFSIAEYTAGDYRVGSAWEMPAGGGTAENIKAYVKDPHTFADVDCKVFINQKDSGGAGNHGQIATKENLACVKAVHWETFTLGSEELTGGVNYILNIIGNSEEGNKDYQVAGDENGAVASYYDLSSYDAPESPWTLGASGITRDYSIYCTYEAAAPPPAGAPWNIASRVAMMGA